VNRILVDNNANNSDTITIDVNDNLNYLINNLKNKYIINVTNSNSNILMILENDKTLDITFNINNSSVVFNCINYNGNDENINVNLNEENSKVEIYNSVISKTKQHIKINTYHNKSKTYSNIYNFGSTKDDGSIIFDVISKVDKGNKKCILNQESKIISLNNYNDNEINPILLIDEYDTEAKHSAFIGKFNEQEVFYLQSRGIKKKDAYRLLLNGFLIGKMKITTEEKEFLQDKINNVWR